MNGGQAVQRRREVPRQVPPPTPHFINQRRVLALADAAVPPDADRPRILVFVGPPGMGKSEVARYWVHRRSDEFPDGQFHANLSGGVDTDGLVSSALREFLVAAGVESSAIPDTVDGRAACFRSWSAGKRVAVVLDGVLTPSQVRLLTPGPGSSVVLVTAASALTGLRIRDLVTFIDLEPLEDDFAFDLLGRLVGPDRVAAEPDAARELVAMCAGLPIAVCVVGGLLSARRARRLGLLAEELRDERNRLTGLSRIEDLSVDAVFSTAYRRLGRAAQWCHRALGVHPGNGPVSDEVLRAAVALPAGELVGAVDELLASGLLSEEPDGRYRQHPLLGLHARKLAEEVGDAPALLGRMIDHYVGRAVRAGHAVIPQRGWLATLFDVELGAEDPDESMRWLRAERENLRVLVDPMVRLGRLEQLCRLAVALWPLHERGKHFDDLIALGEPAVAAADELGRPDRGALLRIQLSFAHMQRGAPELAHDLCRFAAEAAGRAGIPTLEATAVESRGVAALALDKNDEAESLLRRNLELAEAIGDRRRLALARFHLAKVLDPAEAVALLDLALAGFRDPAVADGYNVAKTQWWLGRKLLPLRRWDDARAHLDDALAVMRDRQMVYDQAMVLETLGDLAVARGAPAAGAERLRESLAITQTCGFVRDADRIRARLADLAGAGAGDDAVGDSAEGDG